jgi:hypothetical protein
VFKCFTEDASKRNWAIVCWITCITFFVGRTYVCTGPFIGNITGGQGLLKENCNNVNNLFSQLLQDNWSNVVRAGSFVGIEVDEEL